MQAKYDVLENAQDQVFDKVDSFEAALLGLTEMVSENGELIMENRDMLLAIIEHLQVPYNKPPAGFVKE